MSAPANFTSQRATPTGTQKAQRRNAKSTTQSLFGDGNEFKKMGATRLNSMPLSCWRARRIVRDVLSPEYVKLDAHRKNTKQDRDETICF